MALFEDDNAEPEISAQVTAKPDALNVDIGQAHPRENPYFVGHRGAEAKFLKAWHSDYFHPVQLLSGAAGIGKATFAYRIARYVLGGGAAPNSLDCDINSPAGNQIFRQIMGNAHPNLMVLEPGLQKISGSGVETGISVDWVRRLVERSHQKAAQSGWRVHIIDKADNMTPNAVNAALKILEEPPRQCLFLIVCDSPYRLPPPLRSRCQEIHLNPLTEQEVLGFLQLSDIEPDPMAVESLAQLSDGGIGRALVWWRIGALAIYDELIYCLNASLQNISSQADIFALSERIAADDAKEQKKSEQNIGYSFDAFTVMVGDYLAKAIFAFTSGQVPPVVRPHIDDGIIEKLMASAPNVENWLDLRHMIQVAAAKSKPPLRLEKQQTVLEILWRLRYACRNDWQAALRKFD